MTNREYYKDKIFDIACDGYLVAFDNRTNEMVRCCTDDLLCRYCKFAKGSCAESIRNWMAEEYVEPQVDWSKVSVDTPILVKNHLEEEWERRYFAKYEDGKVYVFANGRTSWNSVTDVYWKYAKLYEEGVDD